MKIEGKPNNTTPTNQSGGLAGEEAAWTNSYREHHFRSLPNRSTRTLSYALTLVGVSAIAFLAVLLLLWYTAISPE